MRQIGTWGLKANVSGLVPDTVPEQQPQDKKKMLRLPNGFMLYVLCKDLSALLRSESHCLYQAINSNPSNEWWKKNKHYYIFEHYCPNIVISGQF